MLQPLDDLENFYLAEEDPWGYENNPSDENRKAVLIEELIKLPKPKQVLDIGCGHGFITRDLVGEKIVGVDISPEAIRQAKKMSKAPNISYVEGDIFDLSLKNTGATQPYDMVIITGVMYGQYIGHAKNVIYHIVDNLLAADGYLVSVHIKDWYSSRFPYVLLKQTTYSYREYQHLLEIYKKK